MEALHLMAEFGMRPRGIIHVGANTGQEFEAYRASGATNVLYIEPIGFVYQQLQRTLGNTPGHHAVKALCAETTGRPVRFGIASNRGESSSLLGLEGSVHASVYPQIVFSDFKEMTTIRLDDVIARDFAGASISICWS